MNRTRLNECCRSATAVRRGMHRVPGSDRYSAGFASKSNKNSIWTRTLIDRVVMVRYFGIID